MERIEYFKGDYFFLSNFYVIDVEYEGKIYPTSEHAYVAAKTLDLKIRDDISILSTPGKAKRFGREIELRSDWEDVKIREMRVILDNKFSIPEMEEKLLATEGMELIETNNWGDVFWGVDVKGNGANNLGKLLMGIRNEKLLFY